MEHRHLLPDEIDQLVDGEAGFGVAPLQAHVERCERCRSELEAMRAVVRSLEELPHHAPSPLFAERVMAQVQIFEPWHVAALDSARRVAPRSAPTRVAAAAMLGVTTLALSVGGVWLAMRVEILRFFFGIAAERVRTSVLSGAGGALADMLGQPAVETLRATGTAGILIAITGFLLVLVTTVLGFRALAGASRRRRT